MCGHHFLIEVYTEKLLVMGMNTEHLGTEHSLKESTVISESKHLSDGVIS